MRKYLGSWLFRYSNTSTGLPLEYSTVSVCCMHMYMGSMMWVWGWWWEHVNVLAQLRFVSYTQTSHSINKSQYQQVIVSTSAKEKETRYVNIMEWV